MSYLQELRRLGGRLLVQPFEFTPPGATDPIEYPLIHAGIAPDNVQIKNDRGQQVIYDPFANKLVPRSRKEQKSEISIMAKTVNSASHIMALVMSSLPPAALTQSATAVTGAAHRAFPGAPIQITNPTTHLPEANLASIQAIVAGSDTLTVGEDYVVSADDLRAGLVNIAADGSITAPTDVTISYTRKTSGGELITPGSGVCQIEGSAKVMFKSCEHRMMVWHIPRVSISFDDVGTPADKDAEVPFNLLVLDDEFAVDPQGKPAPTGYILELK